MEPDLFDPKPMNSMLKRFIEELQRIYLPEEAADTQKHGPRHW